MDKNRFLLELYLGVLFHAVVKERHPYTPEYLVSVNGLRRKLVIINVLMMTILMIYQRKLNNALYIINYYILCILFNVKYNKYTAYIYNNNVLYSFSI